MKVYQVFIQDEWNNNYLLGFYSDLKNAIPEINDYLKDYEELQPLEEDDLKEYPSTFGSCFDKIISSEDGDEYIMVRGFIFDKEELLKEINK